MSKLKVRSERTVFTATNEHGDETGTVIVSRSTRTQRVPTKEKRVKVAKSDRYRSGYGEYGDNDYVAPEYGHEIIETTDPHRTVRVIGLPFKALVPADENLTPEEAALRGVSEIRDNLQRNLEKLNDLL